MATIFLTDEEKVALATCAKKLSIPVDWLYTQIAMESSFDPLARNPASGARGLIQFMPSTAKSMGFASTDQLVATYPTITSQVLGPVYAYFASGMPYNSLEDLLAKTFYPKARVWARKDGNWNRKLPAAVQKQNKGIDSLATYAKFAVARARKYGIKTTVAKGGILGSVALGLLLGGLILYRRVVLAS